MKLSGKVAIVTGTSPNIGGGLAQGLADEGARVVCVDVVPDNAQQCAAWLTKRGSAALGIVADTTDEAQVEAMVARVRDTYGGVDILVNNAGILGGESVVDMPLERWNRQIGVNLTGTFLCTKHVARLMVEQGRRGSIIVIVSTAGHQGQAGNIGYCTSKSGLLNFTRAAAMDLAKHHIRVNSLTPTATDPREGMDRAVRWGRPRPSDRVVAAFEPFRTKVPTQRLPTPTDYGRAVVYLVSDDARNVTGTDLRVDSGAVGRYWAWDPSAD